MGKRWIQENPAYWDAAKVRIVGGAPKGVFELGERAEGDMVPGEWWRVEEDGAVLGYGWMDVTWGDGEVLLAVAPEARRKGFGAFILDRLEEEARARGLNYLYNVVRPTHPERESVTRWLEGRGFRRSPGEDLLRRAVPRGPRPSAG
jgi:GNAT superfamily N-acetyltransferase